MKALKCDACGSLYECGKQNGYVRIGVYTDENPPKFKGCKYFDLCPECYEKVKQALRINDESEDQTV